MHAQSNGNSSIARKHATVVRALSSIDVDGILSEPDWHRASSIDDILQREPREGV